MESTYEKYALPYPCLHDPKQDCERREYRFLPDQLIGALSELLPRFQAFDAQHRQNVISGTVSEFRCDVTARDGEIWRDRIVLPDPAVETMGAITIFRETLAAFEPDFMRRFDRALLNGHIEVTPAYATGLSAGHCCLGKWYKGEDGRLATMVMTFDRTVNDPVYLAHEFGHYLAEDRRNRFERDYWVRSESRVVAETQAFFLQLAFYDAELNSQQNADLKATLQLQRLGETLSITSHVHKNYDRLQQVIGESRSGSGSPDQTIDPPLHSYPHPFGFVIASAVYDRTMHMSAPEKRKLFGALYPAWERHPKTDGVPPLASILSAVDVTTEPGLRALFQQGADALLKPIAQIAPKPPRLPPQLGPV